MTDLTCRASAIRDLLKGRIGADAAATEFTSRVASQKTPNKAEGQLYGMWSLLTDAAIAFPEQQEKVCHSELTTNRNTATKYSSS